MRTRRFWTEWVRENPVLHRERLRRTARTSRRAEVVRWSAVGAIVAAYAAGAHLLTEPAVTPWVARGVLVCLVLAYLLLVTAVLPAVSGSAFSGDREAGTLEALQLTGIRPSQLLVGKFWLSYRWVVRMLGYALPLLAMAFVAGRLPGSHAMPALVVLATAPLPPCLLALWLSSRFRTRSAVPAAYALCGLLFWATLLPAPLLAVRSENVWWYANPLWQASLLILGEPGPGPLARPLLPEWVWFLLACVALPLLPLWDTHRWLKRAMTE